MVDSPPSLPPTKMRQPHCWEVLFFMASILIVINVMQLLPNNKAHNKAHEQQHQPLSSSSSSVRDTSSSSSSSTTRRKLQQETSPLITDKLSSVNVVGTETSTTKEDEDKTFDVIEKVESAFVPGALTNSENGLLLSMGLTSRVIGVSGENVTYSDGSLSEIPVHVRPDFGAVFVDSRPDNVGGWIYVSNSEHKSTGKGGVGAFTFNKHAELIDYRMLLNGTTSNCGGGKTPWNTWISCEETTAGRVLQVDPLGQREPAVIAIGNDGIGGKFESFSYDLRGTDAPQYFVTEDADLGALQRFRPTLKSWEIFEWDTLHGEGVTDYLLLHPSNMTYGFTNDREAAKLNAGQYYPNSEGIDSDDGDLYFVSKKRKLLYILDLRAGTYTNHSTKVGAFDDQPDQVARIIMNSEDLLFFTEEGGGGRPGIHARDSKGLYFTILEGLDNKSDETTGLAISPDGKHVYFAMQKAGVIFDVTRLDGLPFHSKTLNIRYHNNPENI